MDNLVKRSFLITFDVFILYIAHTTSYLFFEPLVSLSPETFFIHLMIIASLYILFGLAINIFDKINRFTSIRETFVHVLLVSASFTVGTILDGFFGEVISYRHVVLSYLISVMLIPGSRVAWRIYIEYRLKLQNKNGSIKGIEPIRTLIIGAGEGGGLFIRFLRLLPDIHIVGILDDDKDKQGKTIFGYPVIGKVANLEETVEKYHVDQITIAIPSLSKDEMKRILTEARKTNVKTNQMPYIEDVLSGNYTVTEFKEIEITDLLGRDEVKLDSKVIGKQVSGKTILISGAGGSIGSEISRQVAKFSPKNIILLGHGEYSIFKIEYELSSIKNRTFDVIPVIADVQDRERIFEVMHTYKPDIVYHTAAHKHVPLMESNPREAVKNNIHGTKNIAEAAKDADIKNFVMVSTDKAVNPPNIMGATKRIAEMIVVGLNEQEKTNFVAVRFGNVLNSSGSVIPIFNQQIEKGGPVTVTDFRMTRYFMTIPEASRLVMQAGALANGGEVFILDMGKPIKIYDLAKQMIWLSGYSKDEIEVTETGIRPGEKLYEELLADEENIERQIYEKIFVGKVNNLPLHQVYAFLGYLDKLSDEELKGALIHFANNTKEENGKNLSKILQIVS